MKKSYDEDELEVRYQNSPDTLSLISSDGCRDFDDSDVRFQSIMREMLNDTERFIVLSLEHGFSPFEIAWMKGVHPSTITRIRQKCFARLEGLMVIDAIKRDKNRKMEL